MVFVVILSGSATVTEKTPSLRKASSVITTWVASLENHLHKLTNWVCFKVECETFSLLALGCHPCKIISYIPSFLPPRGSSECRSGAFETIEFQLSRENACGKIKNFLTVLKNINQCDIKNKKRDLFGSMPRDSIYRLLGADRQIFPDIPECQRIDGES